MLHLVHDSPVRFDLRLLPSFVAVAEELHFARAAERIGIAQPALSQQIRRLETQLGVRLFERDARRVELTAAGEALLGDARAALHAAYRGADAARRVAAGTPFALSLAVDPDVPRRLVARVRRVSSELEEVELRVVRQHQGDALAAMHDGTLDGVVGWGRMPYGLPVRTLPLDQVEIVAVVRADHPEAARAEMPRSVFAAHSFVMFQREPTRDVHDWIVTAATGRQPEQLRIEHVPSLDDGSEAMLRGAEQGCGLTLVMRERFDAAEHPDLRAVPFSPPLMHDVLLIWPPDRESPQLQRFAALLADQSTQTAHR
jgi:DNA-binding transcriptional LysR family regulator